MYKIIISPFAEKQILEIASYIANELHSPIVASNFLNNLRLRIQTLNEFPKRFPLVEMEPWKSKGIRRTLFNCYVVYFVVDDKENKVLILATVYQKRDQETELSRIA